MKNYSIKLSFLLSILVSTIFTSEAHFTTKGPYGGSVTCLLATDTVVYIGTTNGGVFRTTSAAATSWRYANYDGLTNASISSLTSIGGYVIAGTAGGGMFKSNNAGNSWTASNSGLSNLKVLSLITAGDHVIAGTSGGGVFLSHDSGSTWEGSNVGLTNLVVTGFAFDGVTIYAATKGGVFSSVDEGDSWTAMNTGLVNLNIRSIAVSGNNLFIANTNGVFVTSTSSTNWTQSNTGLDTSVNSLYAAGGILYAATNSGVFQSPDQNISWTAANTDYSGAVAATVVYGGKLFAGTKDDGIYRSTSLSPISWKEFNTGFNNLETYAIYNSGTLVIAATNKGLFVSNDLAANYVRSNTGLTDSLHITSLAFGGSKLYAATQNAGVFVSADTGITWMAVNTGLSATNIQKLIATNAFIYAATFSGDVFVSPLSTISWSLTTGLPAGILPTAFATDGSTHVFLGASAQGVFMCMDNQTWSNTSSGLGNLNISSLVISGSILYAGTDAGVFKRELMGPWSSAINTGLPTQQITALASAGQWVAAGFKGGVYVTYDQGASWKAPNVMQYIPAYADITAISFTSLSTRIFVATPYNCLYSNGTSELPTGIKTLRPEIGQFDISPNPSNGAFSIDFKNIKATVQSVKIYDITGQQLYESTDFPSRSTASFSLNGASGIYFITIQTDRGTVSKKLILN